MNAKEYVSKWLDEKYGGSKEIGDWTPGDVVQFAEDYACASENDVTQQERPVSDLIEELRDELYRTREKLRDIRRDRGFGVELIDLEGGITCIISAAYQTVNEIKRIEEANCTKP